MLNPDSPLPLYHQLANLLLQKIRMGEYLPGSRIPSENSLAKTYGIGRPTARQATDLLVRKNILDRRRGSGTFVREQKEEVDLFSLGGTIASFQQKGISLKTTLVQPLQSRLVAEDPENPFSGQTAYFMTRLSKVFGDPVLLEDIYLEPELFPGIERYNLEGRSLSRIVAENFYLQPVRGNQSFRISTLRGKPAEWLQMAADEPVLKVQRFLHFTQMKNGIYSELYCRTDRFVFSQTIGGIQNG